MDRRIMAPDEGHASDSCFSAPDLKPGTPDGIPVTLIVLIVIIFYLMVRLNRALMSRMRGKAAGVAANAAKALIAALLVIVVAGWLVQSIDRQGWLPEATRQASYTYPVLKTANSVTGGVSRAFAETFHEYTLLVKKTFTQ